MIKARLIRTSFAIALAFCFARASFGVSVTIVDAKFNRSEIELQQMDSTSLKGVTPQGPIEFALRDLVMIERDAGKSTPNSAVLQLVLRNGERLSGHAVGFANDSVSWMTTTLGQRDVPLAQIEQIAFAGSHDSPNLSSEEATRDVLLLANGDRASGIITSMDAKAVTVQTTDGQPLTIEWPNIRQVRLAQAGDVIQSTANWRVALADGSVCDVDSVDIKQQMCVLKRGTAATKVQVDAIRSLENLAGRAKLLLRLPTIKTEYAPYFPRTGSENTIEVPDKVTLGDVKTSAFIAVRPYSRITWAIPDKQSSFKTRFAVASLGSLANCHVRVWLDGQNVLDRAGLTSDSPLGTFETPVGSAKTITLEVDFGENFDVQDQLYWIEPAFIAE